MSGSISIPYALGTKVWRAAVERDAEIVTCPVCAGTLKHSVTLGNGETCEVFCDECGAANANDYGHSWLEQRGIPVGMVRRYRIRPEVEEVTLAEVEVRGEEITYYAPSPRGGRWIFYMKDIFPTEAEARAHSENVLVAAAQRDADALFLNNLVHGRLTEKTKKAARSAGWWWTKRKEAVETLAKIDERLARLKGVKRTSAPPPSRDERAESNEGE